MKITKRQLRSFLNESRGRVNAEADLAVEFGQLIQDLYVIRAELEADLNPSPEVVGQAEELDATIQELQAWGQKLMAHFKSAPTGITQESRDGRMLPSQVIKKPAPHGYDSAGFPRTEPAPSASGARQAKAVEEIEAILNELFDDGVDNAGLITLLEGIIRDIGRGYVGQPT